MRSVFIWCFCQWVGEELEGKDSDSVDCDCNCVVEWWGGENSSEWIYAAWQWGQKKLRVDSMQICLNDCHYSLFS